MTIAELHGKLVPDRLGGAHERMEDLLTSDVFGTMKYAGWEHGFMNWLLKAEPAPVEPSPPPIKTYLHPAKIIHVHYSFWPRMKNNREPDVALLFCLDSAESVLIVVEAKYFSGTSDWEGDEENDPFSLTGSQIADQVQGLKQMSAEELLEWFKPSIIAQCPNVGAVLHKIHFFVTMHMVMPVHDYERSAKRLGKSWPLHSYWLSWTTLAECLKGHLDQPQEGLTALLSDLYRLLDRKDMLPFMGFDMDPWRVYSKASSFWYEHWWFSTPQQIADYQSFWHEVF